MAVAAKCINYVSSNAYRGYIVLYALNCILSIAFSVSFARVHFNVCAVSVVCTNRRIKNGLGNPFKRKLQVILKIPVFYRYILTRMTFQYDQYMLSTLLLNILKCWWIFCLSRFFLRRDLSFSLRSIDIFIT